jgi:hypothetical protein
MKCKTSNCNQKSDPMYKPYCYDCGTEIIALKENNPVSKKETILIVGFLILFASTAMAIIFCLLKILAKILI